MIMYGFTDTYDFSSSFMFINEQWDLIHDSFIDYINKGFNLVDQKEKDLIESIKRLGVDNHEYFDDIETDKKRNIHYFKTIFLNAGLIYAFSQFEYCLGKIEESTRELFDDTNEKTPVLFNCRKGKGEKIKNNIIVRRKKEILKISSLQYEFDNQFKKQWDRFIDYQKIRNIITHGNGTFDKKTLTDRFTKIYPDLRIIRQINNTYDLYLSKELLIQIEKEMTVFLKDFMQLIYDTSKLKKAQPSTIKH